MKSIDINPISNKHDLLVGNSKRNIKSYNSSI